MRRVMTACELFGSVDYFYGTTPRRYVKGKTGRQHTFNRELDGLDKANSRVRLASSDITHDFRDLDHFCFPNHHAVVD
jgi:hypothetical protein